MIKKIFSVFKKKENDDLPKFVNAASVSSLKPFDPESAKLLDNFINECGDVYTLCDDSVYCFVVSENDKSKNFYASFMTREMAEKNLFVMPKDANLDMSTE